MGKDGAALSRQAERSGSQRQGQPTFYRGRAVDRPNRQPLAGSAALVRPLEQRVHALPRLVRADIWKRLFDAVSGDPDMEYTMVDATIVKVHRHGQGAKGGPKTKRSAARKVA